MKINICLLNLIYIFRLATESTEEMPCNLRGNNDKYNFEGYDNDSGKENCLKFTL